MHQDALIKIIDLEHDDVPVNVERAKVVLLVRVVRMAEVIEDRDGFDDPLDSLGAEGRNAWRSLRFPSAKF